MSRLFGGRRPNGLPEPLAVQSREVGTSEAQAAASPVTAMLAAEMRKAPNRSSPSPERELLEQIAAFRGAVADALYAISDDYQILCNLAHADLEACNDIVEELRQRLAGNAHYAVLAKLDEAYALVEARVGGVAERR
jgi:hypothetical protein